MGQVAGLAASAAVGGIDLKVKMLVDLTITVIVQTVAR